MFLKDFLFPKLCLGCQSLGSYICINCQQELKFLEKDNCIYCGKNSYMGLTHPGCKREYGIDGVIAFYVYNSMMQKIIKNIKYRLAIEVFNEFCQIIQPKIQNKLMFYKQLSVNGLLQPVPLYSTKLKSRGFNQALLIGKFFNTTLRIPIVDYFKRVKNTVPQAQLKQRKDRYKNIRGAFDKINNPKIKGKTIVIIDDVTTSSFTIKELGKKIKRAGGAGKVFAITLAKG